MIRGFAIALILQLSSSFAHAQKEYLGTVIVFSEDGENFTLYVNEDKQNDASASKVLADNIYELRVVIRVVFDDKNIPVLKKEERREGKNCTYVIRKKAAGERYIKQENCLDLFSKIVATPSPDVTRTNPAPKPHQLTATLNDNEIKLSDGRTLTIVKEKSDGARHPRITLTAPRGAMGTIDYENDKEHFFAEIPLIYESKNTANNDSYFTLTVDEGGKEKTWHVRMKNTNGYNFRIYE